MVISSGVGKKVKRRRLISREEEKGLTEVAEN